MTRLSRQEAIDQHQTYYYGNPCKYGHVGRRNTKGGYCLDCKTIERKKKAEYHANYRAKTRTQHRLRCIAYNKQNVGRLNAISAKRHAAKIQRQVKWANNIHITTIYTQARRLTECLGIPFHVDHIIPLQGKLVSGLHVEYNLRVITANANHSKRNTFDIQ